ncbi:Transcription factor BOA15 [Cladobotryum mycophilum]|uniref:Transcription factor BOA15 n=1 Tax=Cladobotryum mycophilum TaxID=491253 RepID=A0ABR0SW20_9HYPO
MPRQASAAQSCQSCRRLKRRCSREVPACSLASIVFTLLFAWKLTWEMIKCVRLSKECQYPAKALEENLEDQDKESLILMVQQLERQLKQSRQTPQDNIARPLNPFPTAFFLDPEFFTPIAHSTFNIGYPIPLSIIDYLGSDMELICQQYFSTIHTWFPFMSKKMVVKNVMNYQDEPQASLALLIVCMRLASDLPGAGCPSSPDYLSAKELQHSLEAAGRISLPLLQAIMLLGLYEIGHGILPAGYLTLGQAARVGTLMGLHCRKNITSLFKSPDTWSLREEERRTWWCIIILENYINLGPKGLASATPEPCQGHLLPVNDRLWDMGEIGPNESLYTIGFSSVTNISQFARTSQAAHILGRVLYHRADYNQPDRLDRVKEALQLHYTLSALESYIVQARIAALEETLNCSIDMALCCSARLTLYDMYGCNEPDDLVYANQSRYAEESEMQAISLKNIVEVVSGPVLELAHGVLLAEKGGLETMSPLLVECIYHAATECQWFLRENDSGMMQRSFGILIHALRVLHGRWRVAGQY